MQQTICLNHTIIINPLASELISQYGNYTIRGVEYRLTRYKFLLYDFKTKKISPNLLHITQADLEDCFISNPSNGERYPLYLSVPCGHCEVCKASKVSQLVHRCKLETMLYPCKPIFITLTYDEIHKKECGVCLRDVQLFFKRFRQNLYRSGYREKIRYVLVSEYGTRTHRPHYHAILWNLHQSDILQYREIRDLLEKSWSNGFILSRFVDPCNDKAFYYTAKYLRKDCCVPEGCNKTFILSSRGNGGIGSAFIDKVQKHIAKHLNTKYKYVNKFNNKTEDLQFNRYVLNRVLPSFCRSLPPSLKTHVRLFVLNYSILKNRNNPNYHVFKEKESYVRDFFGKFFFVPQLAPSEITMQMEDTDSSLIRQMLQSEIVIDKAISKGVEFYARAKFLDQRRKLFLEKLFKYSVEVDLIDRAYNFKRSSELARQREVL